MPLVLITATKFEAELIHKRIEFEPQSFSLGELFKAKQANVYLSHLGIGKVNTAAGLALLITKLKPQRVIQFGIAGAYPNSKLKIGEAVIAKSEFHIDCGVKTAEGWQDMQSLGFPLLIRDKAYYNLFPTNLFLQNELPKLNLKVASFATSETVTGKLQNALNTQKNFKVSVESMEGAAAAQVCLALNTPFTELRAISNIVGERDKTKWQIKKAISVSNKIILEYIKKPRR